MKFRVVVDYDRVTRSYAVYCPELPGCASAGDTEAEALRNIAEAIQLYLEPCDVEVRPGGKIVEVELVA
jgi:predicted RNase H-like HicB family nuclease